MPKYSRRSTSCWPLVVEAVADLGADVEIVHPLAGPLELSALRLRHDLYVLRKLSGLSLSLAGALHELGAAIVNPYSATAAIHDKIVAAGVLQRAGVPVPATYTCAHPGDLAPQLEAGPLILQPHDGGGGAPPFFFRDTPRPRGPPFETRQTPLPPRYPAPPGPDPEP